MTNQAPSEFFLTKLPANESALLDSLYAGNVFLLVGNPATQRLVDAANQELDRAFSDVTGGARVAQCELSGEDFFARIGKLRRQFFEGPRFVQHVKEVIASLGVDLGHTAYDPARLRTVCHEGHLNPAAAAVYHGHRDTWYSNPEAMITWWIPLQDVQPSHTFDFYPDWFDRPAPNDSATFDFDHWVRDGQKRRIGWQEKKTGLRETYPRLLADPSGRRFGVQARRAQLLLFSGQHLHQTRQHIDDFTRFSLDFRTVHLQHFEQSIGPENVDNQSTGSAVVQWVRPEVAT